MVLSATVQWINKQMSGVLYKTCGWGGGRVINEYLFSYNLLEEDKTQLFENKSIVQQAQTH